MISKYENAVLLLMAVAEPTPILARSLIAQYIRIPALVQTSSFLRKAKTIHLVLGASQQLSYPNLQLCGVQFSHPEVGKPVSSH